MAPKRDDLAKRFESRLKQAPARGAIVASTSKVAPKRPAAKPARPSGTRSAAPTPSRTASPRSRPTADSSRRAGVQRGERIGRHAAGGRLRGHLVPRELHGDARRRKLRLESEEQRRITWDEVAAASLDLLLSKRTQTASLIEEVNELGQRSNGVRRLVQATIPIDLDTTFAELRLDLSDKLGHDISYEALWASALLLWVRSR